MPFSVNECLSRAVDKRQLTNQMITDAEVAYSAKRIDSLQEEWFGVYPFVSDYWRLLTRQRSSFRVSELSKAVLKPWAFSTILLDSDSKDPVAAAARSHFIEDRTNLFEFTLVLLDAMYMVGLIGLKPEPTAACCWSYFSDHRPAPGSLKPTSIIQVHPTFWRALGVRPV